MTYLLTTTVVLPCSPNRLQILIVSCAALTPLTTMLVFVRCTASYDVANQKANKAMDTSDLSTTEAHSNVEDAGRMRARQSPARYSPTPCREIRPRVTNTAQLTYRTDSTDSQTI